MHPCNYPRNTGEAATALRERGYRGTLANTPRPATWHTRCTVVSGGPTERHGETCLDWSVDPSLSTAKWVSPPIDFRGMGSYLNPSQGASSPARAACAPEPSSGPAWSGQRTGQLGEGLTNPSGLPVT